MSTLKADTIQNTSGGAATLTKQATAKAFIHYSDVDGTFDDSFNASSTTDNGSGDATYGLTNSMGSADFPATGEAGGDLSSYYSRMITHTGSTASSVRARYQNPSSYSTTSVFRASSIVFGDLA